MKGCVYTSESHTNLGLDPETLISCQPWDEAALKTKTSPDWWVCSRNQQELPHRSFATRFPVCDKRRQPQSWSNATGERWRIVSFHSCLWHEAVSASVPHAAKRCRDTFWPFLLKHPLSCLNLSFSILPVIHFGWANLGASRECFVLQPWCQMFQ